MIKIFGDLHYTNNEVIDNKITSFLKSNINSDDVIFFVGDVFDKSEFAFKDNLFYKFLSNIKNKVYIILGNHDFGKGVSFKIINYFSDNVKVVDGCENVVIDKFNFILNSYYRYDKDLSITSFMKEEYKNILLCHTDIDFNDDIYKNFDYVINGHIHQFSRVNNIINIGAVREVSFGEVGKKYYAVIDNDLRLVEIDDYVRILRYNYNNINELKIDKDDVVILNILKNNEDDDKIMNEIKEKYGDNVIVKIKKKDIDFEEVKDKIEKVDVNFMNYEEIFDKYLELFANEYKFEVNKDEMKKMFNYYFSSELEKENCFIDIKFNFVECKNFRLFKDMKINFDDIKDGVSLIKGENLDETEDDKSSNESGKSTIANAILYCLNQIDKIYPLSFGEKEGFVKVGMVINNDNILIEKKFKSKKDKIEYDIFIKINGDEFYKNETNTNKLNLFFDKYKIDKVINFIIMCNSNFIESIFSNRNVEKRKILQNIFYVLTVIDKVMERVKEEYNNIKNEYESNKVIFEERKSKRYDYLNLIKDKFFELRRNIFKLSEEKEKLKNVKVDFDIDKVKKIKNIYDVYGFEKILKYKNLREDYFDIIEENENILKKKKILMDDINRLSAIIGDVVVYKKEYDINVVREEERLYKIFNNIKDIKDKIDTQKNYDEIFIRFNSDINRYESEHNILKGKWREVKDKINKIDNSIISNKCEYCGSVITNKEFIEEKKKELIEELKKIEEDGKNIANNLKKVQDEFENFKVEYDIYKRIRNNIGDLNLLNYKFKYTENEIKEILEYEKKNVFIKERQIKEKELKEAESRYIEIEKIDGVNRDEFKKLKDVEIDYEIDKKIEIINVYEENKKKIDVLENSLNIYLKEYNNIESQILEYNKRYKISDIKKILEKIENKYKNIDSFNYILRGKNNFCFDKYFINMLIKQLEDIYNNFLVYLFKRDIKLEMDTFTFVDGVNEVDFLNFSSGCKTKIVINMLMTILSMYNKLGINSNVIFIDELFDKAIDNVNFKRMYNLLKMFSDNKKIFVITHKGNEEEGDNVLLVRRKNNVSEVIYE